MCNYCLFIEKPLGCKGCPLKDTVPEGNKPPLGIMPKEVYQEQRLRELREAILRYMAAGRLISIKWVEEYNELIAPKWSRS